MTRTSLLARLILPLVLAAPLLLTGCTAPAVTTETGPSDNLTIAVVTHGTPGDSFWDVVKSGAEQAGEDLNVSITYQGDGDPVKQSSLIDSAVADKVDGIVVSMANPDGLKDSVEAAVAAGIPVVTINSGLERSAEFGALTHVGQSEFIAGQRTGEKLNDAGATRVACVIHEAGNSGLEERCSGVADTFNGTISNVQVDIANIADAQNLITSQLLSDPSIDAVLTLNSGLATAATQAVADAGSDARVATFDVSSDVTDLILDKKVLFAVDQQPYSQGYLPVTFLTLLNRNGDQVGGGQPVYSGPGFVTLDNAAEVAEFAQNGTR
ncbi:sugar ABC transporter substrate-binding protein [Klugiella xanthotipulae]|uniref:Monosaccharide ABC transporter substrate-binding protein (CUT2 family) n=1 Tax=Klugiella xanthotipulae TaxID=244735 RepID=A0A543I499_9MICO|nr:sugar ABC transporter substrate-binding protein [Klugiella xanthotipulae]TQM65387.1 monosaccharide ABC transporter substrate-binding protein (CUT2 family) [Klugiella xanthotipulae]